MIESLVRGIDLEAAKRHLPMKLSSGGKHSRDGRKLSRSQAREILTRLCKAGSASVGSESAGARVAGRRPRLVGKGQVSLMINIRGGLGAAK